MIHELRILLTAVLFYTRIPCPAWVGHGPEQMRQSRKYFPMIGGIVGAIMLAVYFSSTLIFPKNISLLLSMGAGVLTTGAFHEDGFADVCDGFGGGWSKEQILQIMKDSRVGTFGVVGIGLLLSLKYLILVEIATLSEPLIWSTIFCGQISSRLIASIAAETHEYVRDEASSKSGAATSSRIGWKGLIPGVLFTGLTFFLLPSYWLALAVLGAYGSKVMLSWFFKKWIGGYTGDCLGAIQQVSEVVFYLGIYAIWICL
ncbi:adenosylcobinamide-GDP ribazoletransferase [Siphonobacter sp. SORGH_AS_0500]|uniref:adenosylcobinamide-GDP ribazoletransferase n=1 Tax=Siphonobacter sp. SORGH_AS_0500 TaxID=1864824 RepID=UPI002859A2E5|nr:adenosylcobinamide-GDP ribazoletransferase [Siphonobacter sp. SORGH_AS_0500]MDR6196196.1 adenosylcobinamide-GDP ribazoletransferase [Siphonobacter sp. SORGH_AS_0500]